MFSETAIYGLKTVAALLRLGAVGSDRVYSPAVAMEAGSPEAYVQKLVTKLAKAGILLSKKGKGRGCGIAVNPEALDRSIADILRLCDACRPEIEDAGAAGRILDGLLKGMETRTESLKIRDLVG